MRVFASVISTIGNPLVIGLSFGFYFYFTHEEPEALKYLPLLFSLIIVLPLVSFIGYNVLTRNFTDFDVSNRKKRNSVYILSIFLFGLLSAILSFYRFPPKAILLSVALLVHILVSYLINQKVKVSMHTSISFLFAWIFFPINAPVAVFLFFFGFLNAWSRVALGRHTKEEVFSGFALGNLMGFLYIFAFYNLL